MLNDYLTADTVLFASDVDGWRDAILRVAAPLKASGAITDEYEQAMIDSIAAGGTYINLGFGIALAHSRPENGVLATGISSLRVSPSVLLNDDPAHPIDLFFCLAATNATGHLEAMQELATLLSDDDMRSRLLAAESSSAAIAVISEIGNAS